MPSRNVLFIVEGESAEPSLIKTFNKCFNLGESTNIYSYGTSIYQLYEELKLDEYLDIVLHLKSKATRKSDKKMLSKDFAAIYLIFDFEPQDKKFTCEKIIKMNEFFNESLENGLLLISYPMLESFKHLKKMPDKDFLTRTIKQDQIVKYKQIVGNESAYTDFTQYHRKMMAELIVHHMVKLNYIIKNEKTLPNQDDILKFINCSDFIQKQYDSYLKNRLNVVSTAFYYIVELLNKDFYFQLELPNIIDVLSK